MWKDTIVDYRDSHSTQDYNNWLNDLGSTIYDMKLFHRFNKDTNIKLMTEFIRSYEYYNKSLHPITRLEQLRVLKESVNQIYSYNVDEVFTNTITDIVFDEPISIINGLSSFLITSIKHDNVEIIFNNQKGTVFKSLLNLSLDNKVLIINLYYKQKQKTNANKAKIRR